MTGISSAVEYLHFHKITHRDLKPENIVLQDENNTVFTDHTYTLLNVL